MRSDKIIDVIYFCKENIQMVMNNDSKIIYNEYLNEKCNCKIGKSYIKK